MSCRNISTQFRGNCVDICRIPTMNGEDDGRIFALPSILIPIGCILKIKHLSLLSNIKENPYVVAFQP